nr:hypothetical protein [Anatilimnocola floriformis]
MAVGVEVDHFPLSVFVLEEVACLPPLVLRLVVFGCLEPFRPCCFQIGFQHPAELFGQALEDKLPFRLADKPRL